QPCNRQNLCPDGPPRGRTENPKRAYQPSESGPEPRERNCCCLLRSWRERPRLLLARESFRTPGFGHLYQVRAKIRFGAFRSTVSGDRQTAEHSGLGQLLKNTVPALLHFHSDLFGLPQPVIQAVQLAFHCPCDHRVVRNSAEVIRDVPHVLL